MGREVRCGDTIRLLVARPASSPARQATTSFLEHLGDLGIVRVHSCVCKCHAIRQMMGRSAFRTNTPMSATIQYSSMKATWAFTIRFVEFASFAELRWLSLSVRW